MLVVLIMVARVTVTGNETTLGSRHGTGKDERHEGEEEVESDIETRHSFEKGTSVKENVDCG
jgi:hypothetical protein